MTSMLQHYFLRLYRDFCMNNKHSSLKTAESSPSYERVGYSSLQHESKQVDNTEISVETQEKQNTNNDVKNSGKMKQRRHSFIQLESNTQIRIQNMILDQIHMQGKVKTRKMSLDNDETCIYSADMYTKDQIHWKNRQITQLTTKKLDSIPIENIKKIKVLSEQPMKGYRLFKITVLDKEPKDYAIRTNDAGLWFSNTVWVCLVNKGFQCPIKREFEGEIEGQIYKKSQFLGNWEKRYINISTKNGLISSKKKEDSPTVRIKQSSQVWTRFQVVPFGNQNHLIIKTWHMMFKYEFAIPLSDCLRWVKAFTLLIN